MTRTAIAFAALILLAGCRAKPGAEIPDHPDSITLFSIDGTENWKGKTTGETLYGCPVIGSVEVTDPDQRREVIAAVKSAIRNPPEQRLGCWMPRHVLRVTAKGKRIDVVICFECHSYRSYHAETESARAGGGQIAPEAESLLNGILAKAGVPVVPNFTQ